MCNLWKRPEKKAFLRATAGSTSVFFGWERNGHRFYFNLFHLCGREVLLHAEFSWLMLQMYLRSILHISCSQCSGLILELIHMLELTGLVMQWVDIWVDWFDTCSVFVHMIRGWHSIMGALYLMFWKKQTSAGCGQARKRAQVFLIISTTVMICNYVLRYHVRGLHERAILLTFLRLGLGCIKTNCFVTKEEDT